MFIETMKSVRDEAVCLLDLDRILCFSLVITQIAFDTCYNYFMPFNCKKQFPRYQKTIRSQLDFY